MPVAFASSFVVGESRAAAFLPPLFRDRPARIARAIRAAARNVFEASPRGLPAPLLLELRAQDEELPPSAARRKNIEKLAQPGSTCVITGQQVGLFLGPLYTIYKAASAIAAARAVEEESGVACVPIFWLQTEDHDFPEVNQCHVQRAGAPPLQLSLADDEPERARVSVQHRALGDSVGRALAELDQALAALPEAQEHLALLRQHYRPERTLASAFASVLATLFAGEGLIVFDPRRERVAKLVLPIHRRALVEAAEISALLGKRSEELSEAGFEVQVKVRPGTPLTFFHCHRIEGPRFRPEPRSAGQDKHLFTVGGETISLEELLIVLEREPLRFSTSALLRPIVQDTLFPTVAYVGGPGEINYFAQLAPLYRHFDLEPPLVVPRASFRCVEPRTRSLLEELGLSASDCTRSRDELLGKLVSSNPSHPPPQRVEEELLAAFSSRIAELGQLAGDLGPQMDKALGRTTGTVNRAVSRLKSRYARLLREQDQTLGVRVDRVCAALQPGGIPQERYYGLAYFACRYGQRPFVERVLDELRDRGPFCAEPGHIFL